MYITTPARKSPMKKRSAGGVLYILSNINSLQQPRALSFAPSSCLDSASGFYRAFCKGTGMSPAQYRRVRQKKR